MVHSSFHSWTYQGLKLKVMNYVRNSGIVTITGVQISYGNALKISQLLNFTLILAFRVGNKIVFLPRQHAVCRWRKVATCALSKSMTCDQTESYAEIQKLQILKRLEKTTYHKWHFLFQLFILYLYNWFYHHNRKFKKWDVGSFTFTQLTGRMWNS